MQWWLIIAARHVILHKAPHQDALIANSISILNYILLAYSAAISCTVQSKKIYISVLKYITNTPLRRNHLSVSASKFYFSNFIFKFHHKIPQQRTGYHLVVFYADATHKMFQKVLDCVMSTTEYLTSCHYVGVSGNTFATHRRWRMWERLIDYS
jgi:hypothetical protein